MATIMKNILAVGMVLMVMAAVSEITITSAEAAGAAKSGFLGDYYDKLKPGSEGEPDLMWIKPGVDFTKYKKVMVDYVVFALADDSEYKGIDANEMKKIGDGASKALVNTLHKEFPVVAEPGPDVLRIRAAIVDLKQSRPVVSAVTSVLPVGLGISIIKKGATDSWTGSGATTAEMLIMDSMSQEVLAAGEDKKSAKFDERFSKWGSVEEAFEFWAQRLTKRLVNMRQK